MLGDRQGTATPEEIVDRIRTDVLPSGINHVVLALTDRGLAKDWAGLDLPGLPPLDEQVRLIGTRILPAITPKSKAKL